jgi:hypothetical protein
MNLVMALLFVTLFGERRGSMGRKEEVPAARTKEETDGDERLCSFNCWANNEKDRIQMTRILSNLGFWIATDTRE